MPAPPPPQSKVSCGREQPRTQLGPKYTLPTLNTLGIFQGTWLEGAMALSMASRCEDDSRVARREGHGRAAESAGSQLTNPLGRTWHVCLLARTMVAQRSHLRSKSRSQQVLARMRMKKAARFAVQKPPSSVAWTPAVASSFRLDLARRCRQLDPGLRACATIRLGRQGSACVV